MGNDEVYQQMSVSLVARKHGNLRIEECLNDLEIATMVAAALVEATSDHMQKIGMLGGVT
jgi:hypothetical protein